jgi:hypothetical protein
MVKKIFIVLLLVFIAIQFFRPAKNSSREYSKDISTLYTIPDNVAAILQRDCYDCHSNHTDYPWYAEIQPVAWWLQNHVNEGKQHLNYSEFASYSLKKQAHKLEETVEMIEKGEMPLSSYTIIHRDAVLSKQDADLLIQWASALQHKIERTIPAENN